MSGGWRDVVKVHLGDSNLRSVPAFLNSYPEHAGFSAIQRGRLITLNQSPRKRFHFLVNPSDIQTSYQVANDLRFSDADFNLSEANLGALGDGLMSLNFSLMLDRTYEVYQGNPNYVGGVLHDVLALEQVLGAPPAAMAEADEWKRNPAAEGSAALAGVDIEDWGPSTPRESVLNGVITHKPVRVLFGSNDAFTFDGFVTSLGVHYTHFSHRMVPSRAGVTISMSSLGVASTTRSAPVQSAPGTPGGNVMWE